MLMKAYRLVAPEDAVEPLARRSCALNRDASEQATACVAVAWESPELAAMASDEFLWHQGRRTTCLREALALPRDEGLHKIMPASSNWVFEDLSRVPPYLLACLTAQNLLSLWVPSAQAPHQHAVLLNLQHPALARIQVTARQLTLTRPLLRADFESAEAAPGDARRPLMVPAQRAEFQFGPPLRAVA